MPVIFSDNYFCLWHRCMLCINCTTGIALLYYHHQEAGIPGMGHCKLYCCRNMISCRKGHFDSAFLKMTYGMRDCRFHIRIFIEED